MTHSELKKAVVDILERLNYVVISHFAGGSGRNHYQKKNSVGVPDLICCDDVGNFVGIELKIPPDKLRPEQKVFLDKIKKTQRGRAFVITSIDEAIEIFGKESTRNAA
jgi:hypothetical protein